MLVRTRLLTRVRVETKGGFFEKKLTVGNSLVSLATVVKMYLALSLALLSFIERSMTEPGTLPTDFSRKRKYCQLPTELYEVISKRILDQPYQRRGVGFPKDIFPMRFDSAFANEQLFGNLFIGKLFGNKF